MSPVIKNGPNFPIEKFRLALELWHSGSDLQKNLTENDSARRALFLQYSVILLIVG